MKTLFCSFIALMMSVNAFCSSPDSTAKTLKPVKTKIYHINYYVEGAIIALGMGSDYFAISRLKNKTSLDSSELSFVNSPAQKNLINPIDRWALKQKVADHDLWDQISNYGETFIFLLPSLLIIDKNMRRDWLALLLMYVEGHAVTFTIYNYSPLGPTFNNRYRPITYYPEIPDVTRESGHNLNSFYSGHVASCTYTTFFMVKVYCDYHPEIGAAKYLLYLAASIPPLAIGYARVRALEHFPSDVAVGFGLGAILGIVVPALHKAPCSKYLSLGLSTSPDVVGVSLCWKLSAKHLLPVNGQ